MTATVANFSTRTESLIQLEEQRSPNRPKGCLDNCSDRWFGRCMQRVVCGSVTVNSVVALVAAASENVVIGLLGLSNAAIGGIVLWTLAGLYENETLEDQIEKVTKSGFGLDRNVSKLGHVNEAVANDLAQQSKLIGDFQELNNAYNDHLIHSGETEKKLQEELKARREEIQKRDERITAMRSLFDNVRDKSQATVEKLAGHELNQREYLNIYNVVADKISGTVQLLRDEHQQTQAQFEAELKKAEALRAQAAQDRVELEKRHRQLDEKLQEVNAAAQAAKEAEESLRRTFEQAQAFKKSS